MIKEADLRHYLKTAVAIDEDKPVLADRYICGKEADAVCDGRRFAAVPPRTINRSIWK